MFSYPLCITAGAADSSKTSGTVNEHSGYDQRLIWGLLIGTMAALDGLFSTLFPIGIIK